jgi:hypothetical protein
VRPATIHDVRMDIVNHIRSHPSQFAPFVEGDFETYLENLQIQSFWGGEVSLRAAADLYSMNVRVFLSSHIHSADPNDLTPSHIYQPTNMNVLQNIDIVFTPGHYDSLRFYLKSKFKKGNTN